MTSNAETTGADGAVEEAFGKRLLPRALDQLARYDPERTLGCIGRSLDMTNGFVEFTIGQAARAVDYCAWWLKAQIGQATVKLGYKLLAPSPRNTSWMNSALLEQTQCKKTLIPAEPSPAAQKLPNNESGLKLIRISAFDSLINKVSKHYPFEKSWDEAKWDPVLVLHTSSSTGGPPRPITLNHGAFSCPDKERNLHPVPGRMIQSRALFDFPKGGIYYSSPLPAHLSGFLSMVEIPIFSNSGTIVLGPVDSPPSGKVLSQIMRHYPLRGTFAAPSVIEELILEPGGLEQASKLEFILFMDGPLTTAAGESLSKVVKLCQFYGSTELLEIAALVPEKEDWSYLEFHPSMEVDMQQVSGNIYELVFHKNQNKEPRFGLDWTYPDVEDWLTNDLFQQHPTKPNLWRFHGRTDNLVVLATATKFSPVCSEVLISGSPLIKGAIVTGQGRLQAALLIEPKPWVDRESLIDRIWPYVEHANKNAPSAAQIDLSKIVIASPEKPFRRTERGTVIRKLSIADYTSELDALYLEKS